MSSGKQKLRPWLEEMISKGEIEGLRWLNADKTKFRIPWKHGGKQDWSPDNSRIFMEWAKHTGKYREGVDQPNYPTWKTRLRCAFNKAPDIVELRGESQLNCHEPFRVYVLKESKRSRTTSVKSNDAKGIKPSRKESEGKLEEEEDEEDEEVDVQRQAYGSERKESSSSMIPSMVEEMDLVEESASVERHYSSDLDSILPNGLEDAFSEDVQDIVHGMSCHLNATFPANEQVALLNNVLSLENEQDFAPLLQMNQTPLCPPEVANYSMKVDAYYCQKWVCGSTYNLRLGLRIASSGHATSVRSPSAVFPSIVDQLLSENPPTLYLPFCGGDLLNSRRLNQIIDHVLTKSLTEGLLLWMNEERDIFAYRFCQGAIFHASETETDGKPTKIPLNKDKEEFVKIFTYRNCFNTDHDNVNLHLPPSYDPVIFLCCGEPTDFQDIPRKALIYIKLTPPGYQGSQNHSNSADHVTSTEVFSPFSSTYYMDSCYSQFELESDIELQTCDG